MRNFTTQWGYVAQIEETDMTDQQLRQAIEAIVKEAELAGVSGFDVVDALRAAAHGHPATRYRNEMRIRRLNAEAEASWREPLPWEDDPGAPNCAAAACGLSLFSSTVGG
jgi:hypothetical protein